jgi:hypothetical protein
VVVFGAKEIREVEKMETGLLYLLMETEQPRCSMPPQRMEDGERVGLGGGMTMKKVKMAKGQSMALTNKAMVFVKIGAFLIVSTNQIIRGNECLFTRKGCGGVQFVEDSEMFVMEWNW